MTVEISTAAIDALLPQTQCTRCGYQGCLPYAAAVVSGEADINQWSTRRRGDHPALAALTAARRAAQPGQRLESRPTVAFIDEERCIGCTKCLPPCPVGRHRRRAARMHTVWRNLHRLRTVHRALPGGLHLDGAAAREPAHRALRCPGDAAARATRRHNERIARRAAERAACSPTRSAPANDPAMNPPSARRSSSVPAANPQPTTELEYSTPFELLVAVILSAQGD
jgi:electron transport complex protein RnfB